MEIRRRDSLDYHRQGRKGKIEVNPTKPCRTQWDLSLAYTPGVAEPCKEIQKDPDLSFEYTARGNLVAVVSNGTALEETFQSENDNQMVTMYTPDGSRVALTHYCSKGNQPKMETPAETATTDEFAFGFTGAANLASPEDAHLHRLVLQIVDAEHFTETWTIHEKGRDTKKTFHFTRKK